MMDLVRMRPGARRSLQVLGPLLLLAGLGLLVSTFFVLPGGLDGDPVRVMTSFALRGVGGVLLFGLGGFLTSLGYLKPMSELTATETGGAVEYSAGAMGRGLAGSVRHTGAANGGVRVRCRGCGFLDSEDARFCSGCGQSM